MDKFVTFHWSGKPRDIRKDLISDYKNHIVRIIGRNAAVEFDVDETYEEIREIMQRT